MKLDIEFIKKHIWEEDSRRVTTLHRFFDFSESSQITAPKMFGVGLLREIFVMKNGDIRRYQIKKDWENFVAGIGTFLSNPKSIKYAHDHMLSDSKLFIAWLKKNHKHSFLQKLSNKDLANILMERHKKHQVLLGWQWFGFIGKYAIKEVLQNKLKKYNILESEIESIFVHKRPVSIIEEELYAKKIAYRIKKENINAKDIDSLLKNHLKKFGHIVVYDETNNSMSLAFLRKRVKKYAENKELKKDISKSYLNFKKNKKSFEILLSKYNFNKKDLDLIIFSDDYAHFMELRNQFRALAAVYSKDLFKIIAKKMKLTIRELLCFNDYEINDALLGKKMLSRQEAKKRYEYSAVIFFGSDYLIFSGKKAKKINNIITKKYNLTEIKGTPTNKGIVSGKVKIVIDNNDVKKVKQGEILVSSMTKPVFLLAMKKVSAIVTDEGGALCHAAVISRELNLPCIVGTKIATQVLKDGDYIEVNANTGLIKILAK